MDQLDPETAGAHRRARLGGGGARDPADAGRGDQADAHPRAGRAATAKLRTVIERVNSDDQLKGWWHVANVNAVVRL